MDEILFIKRKIELKGQFLQIISDEIQTMREHLVLLKIKDRLEKSIPTEDPVISRKLDCLIYLLDN